MKLIASSLLLSLDFVLLTRSLVLDPSMILPRAQKHESHPIQVESTTIHLKYTTAANGTTSNEEDINKRQPQTWKVIDKCPDDAPGARPDHTQFFDSACNGASLYTIHCGTADGEDLPTPYGGSCPDGTFCVNLGATDYDDWDKAVCKSHEQYIKLAQKALEGNEREITLDPPQSYPPDKSRQEVLLTSQPNPSAGPVYMADKISMQAEDKGGNPLGLAVSCRRCFRLDLGHWPVGTETIGATITVTKGTDEPFVHAVASHHTEL